MLWEICKGFEEGKGAIAIVPVRDTLHTKVRDTHRLWAKRNYELRRKVYKKNRGFVEQCIGKAKNSMGDRDWTKDFHTASLYVLGRFVLLNLALLAELLLLWLKLLGFLRFWRRCLSSSLDFSNRLPLS